MLLLYFYYIRWEAAYRFGVVGLPYGTLCGGVLTGKYFDGSKWSTQVSS